MSVLWLCCERVSSLWLFCLCCDSASQLKLNVLIQSVRVLDSISGPSEASRLWICCGCCCGTAVTMLWQCYDSAVTASQLKLNVCSLWVPTPESEPSWLSTLSVCAVTVLWACAVTVTVPPMLVQWLCFAAKVKCEKSVGANSGLHLQTSRDLSAVNIWQVNVLWVCCDCVVTVLWLCLAAEVKCVNYVSAGSGLHLQAI